MSQFQHRVREGDCISSIAELYGFRDWRTVYEDPSNGALRAVRPNPNLLVPGDVVVIPERSPRIDAVETTMRHTFVVRRALCTVELRFVDLSGHPIAITAVLLKVDEDEQSLTTDSDGRVRAAISRSAKFGSATIGTYSWPLAFGTLRPLGKDQVVGLQERLNNLGYSCPRSDTEDDVTKEAVRGFQRDRGIRETATLDSVTRAALESAHGC